MAYDDSAFRRRDTGVDPLSRGPRDDSRYSGDSEYGTDAGYRPPDYQVSEYREPEKSESTLSLPPARRGESAVLDDVFDDPEHGDPGRDRMAVHVVWEVLLLLAAGAAAYLVYRQSSDALRGDAFKTLLVAAAALGLLGLAAGLTLRAGAVNLAVGPVALAAALHFAENGDKGLLEAAGIAAAVAAVGGLVVAFFVVGLHVPGWAASLGAALGVIVYIQQRSGPVTTRGDFDPTDKAIFIFGGVAALAVLGGLLGTIKPVRRAIGRFRPVGDPARRRGQMAGVLTAGAIVLSAVFAVGAGVLLASNGARAVAPGPGIEWTGLAVGMALLGGTSAFGRRGGIFGTILAVVLVTLVLRYIELRNWDISIFAVAAVAMGVGLVATRVVEAFGRPVAVRSLEEPEWDNGGEPTPPVWSAPRQESWSSALPAQPAAGRGDWESDRWGTAR